MTEIGAAVLKWCDLGSAALAGFFGDGVAERLFDDTAPVTRRSLPGEPTMITAVTGSPTWLYASELVVTLPLAIPFERLSCPAQGSDGLNQLSRILIARCTYRSSRSIPLPRHVLR